MHIPFVDILRDPPKLRFSIKRGIDRALRKGDFILGEEVSEFEREFADYLGVNHSVGVASGTDAILLCLRALGVGKGDEVIMPAMTFIATMLPIYYVGAKPVLVDILPDSPLIDPDLIEKAITKRTKAIMPVHLHGYVCDMEKIDRIAKKYNLFVIEDTCQAHGSEFRIQNSEFRITKNKKDAWIKAGALGDVGAFSFYPAKNLGGYGDGGMVVTNSDEIFDRVKLLRNYGQKEKYRHEVIGYNNRLDTIQAAVLRAKLPFIDSFNAMRRKNADFYRKRLSSLPVRLPFEGIDQKPNYHIFAIYTDKRDELQKYLAKKNISTVIHYPIPIHLHKATKNLGYKRGIFPNAERFAETTLSLPMFPLLTKDEIEYVSRAIKAFFTSK